MEKQHWFAALPQELSRGEADVWKIEGIHRHLVCWKEPGLMTAYKSLFF